MRKSIHILYSCAALLILLSGCATSAAQSPAPSATPTENQFPDVPQAVVDLALSHLEDTAKACTEGENGFAVTDTELTGLTQLAYYEILPGASVEVYRMEYRLKPEDPNKVLLAGGMSMDEEGWLLQTASMGDPCVVVKNESGTYTLLGTTWDGETEIDGGWAGRLGSLLMEWGKEKGDDSMVGAGRLTFCKAWLFRAEQVMAPFLGSAPTEADPYTDAAGLVWLKLSGYEKLGEQRMDDQLLANAYTVFPKDLMDAFFARYIYVLDSILLEREGGLYVRQDAAQVLGWDYTIELSTLSVTEINESTRFDFSVQGTGHGGNVLWRFCFENGENRWQFQRYYTLASEGSAGAEYTVLLDGTWFGPDSEGIPSGLGEIQFSKIVSDGDDLQRIVEVWDGVELHARVDKKTNVQTAESLSVTSPDFVSWRGIHVGSTRDEVLAAYPEIDPEYQLQVNGTADSLFYGHPIGGYFIGFILKDDCVTQIDLTFAFD